MDLAPVLARLRAELTGFKAIGGAADLEVAVGGTIAGDSLFVVPEREDGRSGGDTSAYFAQRLAVRFGVLLAVTNRRDALGDGALSALTARRDQVKNALIGWCPDPETGEPVTFAQGRVLRFEPGLLWWADFFDVTTYWRKPQ